MSNTESSNITMRAWAIKAYGEPMEMMQLPLPRPGPNDILIRMHGAEVGDWDELVRKGEWPMERPFPLVLGLAGAGTVTSVGKDVEDFREDDPVYAYSYPLYDNGAWAEYMLVPRSYAATPPPAYDLHRAGAIPIVGLTAHETLFDVLEVRKDEVVLVTAASGGVGHIAVQIAKHLEAQVIGTCSRSNVEFVEALGADLVVDYTTQNVVEAIHAAYPEGVNKALNCVSNSEAANRYVQVMAGGGHIVDLPGVITASRPDVRIDSDYVVRGDGARLELVTFLIDGGVVRVEVNTIVPFERAQEALDTVLTKHVVGKVAIRIR